jgi:hypothetical protein
MAYVVARPRGRFEIRESTNTPAGPRARTLATFRVLDGDVLRHAVERSHHGVDEAAVQASARRLGAEVTGHPADHAARALLRELGAGHRPSAGLAALIEEELGTTSALLRTTLGDLARWVGASTADRGVALRDLLLLVDSLPVRPREALQFPPLRPLL